MIRVNEDSGIPLFGLDFLGILDRGTNLIEVKPITTCNLRCKYCFVHAGDYKNNFYAEPEYLIKFLKQAIEIKQNNDIEVHIAPYGEIFGYKDHIKLIKDIRSIPQVKVISIQTNGTLLNQDKIHELEKIGVTRLNISFNSLDEKLASYLSEDPNYNVQNMLKVFDSVLESKIDLLIAPIWFFGVNDLEIIKIIELGKQIESRGYDWKKFKLGIQNYLIYETGRKLKKVKERDFSYFYKRLAELEKKYQIKLKLGPYDFEIHPSKPVSVPVEIGEKIRVTVICEGRTSYEYIGRLNPQWAVKILSKVPLVSDSEIQVEVIKKKTKENLITARFL